MEREQTHLTGYFTARCHGADGVLKWEDTFRNQVTTLGANAVLDAAFAGSGYTAAWYMGIITGPGAGNTYAAADTMASHAGWTEETAYSEGSRPAITFGTAAAAAISTSAAATFSMNNGATVAGAFVCTNGTKGGTTGVLYSAKNFTGGDRTVINGDIISVTYSTELTV